MGQGFSLTNKVMGVQLVKMPFSTVINVKQALMGRCVLGATSHNRSLYFQAITSALDASIREASMLSWMELAAPSVKMLFLDVRHVTLQNKAPNVHSVNQTILSVCWILVEMLLMERRLVMMEMFKVETGAHLPAKLKQDGAAVELLGWFLFVGKPAEIMK
jgi:hypothetical protein